MKTVLLFLMALPLLAQNPSNQDLNVLGHFDMTAGTYSAPFIPVGSDPTGACTVAGAVVMNSTSGQLTGCIALIWTPLGGAGSGNVSGPGSSTNFALAAWNGTTGLVLRNTSVITDGSGNLTANSLTSSGGGAGTLELTQGTVQGSFPANSVSLYAPATIASAYQWKLPAADAAGALVSDGAGTPGTLSLLGFTGTGNLVKAISPTVTGTAVFNNLTVGGTCTGCTGGGTGFGSLTTGTNSAATMTVGTGGAITFSGSGTINANLINGSSPAASATTDTTSASNISSGTLAIARGGTGTGSTLTGLVRGNSSAFTAAELSGDCTTSGSNAITCTKTSGVSFATSATTDTTNASNISSGTLGAARLPNPSATTLGGIESIAAVSHNFLTSISTSGVPAQAQPAFSDLSGSVTAAQLPNPTASTLGGIESFAAVSHNWINTISTSGVPSATRPACADLSDSAASCATDATNAANISSGLLAVARGGTNTASPGLVAGTNITSITGTWPNQTINAATQTATVVHSFGTAFSSTSALTAPMTSYITVPYACTIQAWNITATPAGSATIDIWKIATGSAVPTVTNTITASAVPAISSGTALHSTTLTSWTTSVSANDILGFNLSAVATSTQVTIAVQCQ